MLREGVRVLTEELMESATGCGVLKRHIRQPTVQQRRDQYAAEIRSRNVPTAGVDGGRVRAAGSDHGQLASYPRALRRVLPTTEHQRHKGLNNRAENSHEPTRQRERVMRWFKSAEQATAFLSRSVRWALNVRSTWLQHHCNRVAVVEGFD